MVLNNFQYICLLQLRYSVRKKVLKYAQTTNDDVSPLILHPTVYIGKHHIVILKLVHKIGFIFAIFNSKATGYKKLIMLQKHFLTKSG